ncbi:MAG TPA: hypothetical protein VL096_09135 [Pirellulaceae bacterium]|nr:hypothetical protein [Pirellulaceae bacterium]
MALPLILAEAANDLKAEATVEGWLRYLTELGAWDLISITMALVGVIGVSLWLFVPRRRVPGLNVRVSVERAGDVRFPHRLRLEIRNFSGSPVLIRRAGFNFAGLRPDPQCAMHSETQECEVKFPGRVPMELCEPDCYLRQGALVLTWIAVDPTHTDVEVQEALRTRRVGILRCSIVHLRDKALLFDLRTKC